MNFRRTIFAALVLGLAAGLLGSPAPLAGQQSDGPLAADYLLTGYGTLDYRMTPDRAAPDEFGHDFGASISPILLFTLGDDLLFESEFEYELEGGATSTTLEYVQLTYQGFENVQLTAGKFLLPFGLFSERLHPSWINKLPSMPLLYGHAHGGVAEGSLLPVLSDIGIMARVTQELGTSWTLDLTGWISQGPQAATGDGEEAHDEDDAHATIPSGLAAGAASPTIPGPLHAPGHDDDAGDATTAGLPGIAIGTNTSDNNDNKMLGARIGMVRGGDFEVYLSGFHSMYDAGDFLDFYGTNLAVDWRPGPYELRGEGALLWQEFAGEAEYETLQSPGYYLQASRRFGSVEPVLRWSHLPEAEVDDVAVRHESRQLALGLEYWLAPSVPVKAAYEIDLDGDDRVILQWAYGF